MRKSDYLILCRLLAEAIGLDVQWQGYRSGRTIGSYFIQDTFTA